MVTPLKVLMIEDSANDAELIVHELRAGGFEPAFTRVDTAGGLSAALPSGQWDIILCDYALPGFGGLAAFKIFQTSGLDIPFIVVSGSIGEETAVAAMKSGVNDYIMKDNLRRLAPAVGRELRDANTRREKQRAEERLKQSEERFRTLAENARDLIFRYNIQPATGFAYVSPSAFRLTGYTPEEFYADPFIFARRLPENETAFIDLLRQTTEPARLMVLPFINKQGAQIWFELQGAAIRSDSDEKIAAVECIAREVTERVKAETALRASEEKYRTLVENLPVGVSVNTLGGCPVDFNRVLMQMHGYNTSVEFANLPIVERYADPEDRRRFLACVESGRTKNFEVQHRRRDGSIFWVSQTAIAHTGENGEKQVLVICQDIDEHKKAEEALRASEDLFRNLVENAPVGIAITRLNGSAIVRNTLNQRMHGYDSAEEFMKVNSAALYADVADRNNWLEVAKNGPVKDFELLHRRKDGSTFWVSLTALRFTPLSGEEQLILITQDISERKKAEEELHHHYEAELKLRKALEVEIQRRADFTRALVHELKTPLTPMLATSELMVNNLAEEPWARMARNINRSANNLNNRIEELLDLARGEIGILKLNPLPLDVRQMLVDLTNEVTPETMLFDQSLVLEASDDLPPVFADEGRLRQVMLNLINNACKYNPGKGTITISAGRDGDYLVIRVRDTGKGISEAELAHLFEPYAFLESNREWHSGLGLGLSLSRAIIELHNGKIWVESQPGQGSTFSFSIPIVPVSPGLFDAASELGITGAPFR